MEPIVFMNKQINRAMDSVLIPRRLRTRKAINIRYVEQEDKLHQLVSEYQPHTIELYIPHICDQACLLAPF